MWFLRMVIFFLHLAQAWALQKYDPPVSQGEEIDGSHNTQLFTDTSFNFSP